MRRLSHPALIAPLLLVLSLTACMGKDEFARSRDAASRVEAFLREHYPDRAWQAVCAGGAEGSMGCDIVFTTTPGESLESIVTAGALAADQLTANPKLVSGSGQGAFYPAARVDSEKVATLSFLCGPAKAATLLVISSGPGEPPHDAAWREAFLADLATED